MVKLQLNNRNYYVREGHTTGQIIDSLVKQVNNDKGCPFIAKRSGNVISFPKSPIDYKITFDEK